MHKDSLFSTASPTPVFSCLFDNSRPRSCEVIAQCSVLFAFPWGLVIWTLFFCTCLLCFFFLVEKCPFRPSAHFLDYLLFLLLSCMYSWHSFNINTLSKVCYADIFFHSTACLFISLMVSLLYRSFLVWCSPTYWFFSFVVCDFGII